MNQSISNILSRKIHNHKAGFEINGSINRKEFGLKWNAVTEAGAIVVSDEVRLHLNVQVVKQ